jgi:hypothetical protein
MEDARLAVRDGADAAALDTQVLKESVDYQLAMSFLKDLSPERGRLIILSKPCSIESFLRSTQRLVKSLLRSQEPTASTVLMVSCTTAPREMKHLRTYVEICLRRSILLRCKTKLCST